MTTRKKIVMTLGALILALGAVWLPGIQPGAAAEPPPLDSFQAP